MPFGLVSGVGQGVGVLDKVGDRRKIKGSFGVKLGRPSLTNREFVAQLCGNAWNDRAVG